MEDDQIEKMICIMFLPYFNSYAIPNNSTAIEITKYALTNKEFLDRHEFNYNDFLINPDNYYIIASEDKSKTIDKHKFYKPDEVISYNTNDIMNRYLYIGHKSDVYTCRFYIGNDSYEDAVYEGTLHSLDYYCTKLKIPVVLYSPQKLINYIAKQLDVHPDSIPECPIQMINNNIWNGEYKNIRIIDDPMDPDDMRKRGFYLQVCSNKFSNPIKKSIADILDTNASIYVGEEDKSVLVDKLFGYYKTISGKKNWVVVMNNYDEF